MKISEQEGAFEMTINIFEYLMYVKVLWLKQQWALVPKTINKRCHNQT